MDTVRISAKRKHKKVPNRNHTSEEYIRIQKQTGWSRRTDQWVVTKGNGTHQNTAEKRKKNLKIKESLRDLWDNIWQNSICIIGSQKENRGKKCQKNYLKNDWKISCLKKEIDIQVQEPQRIQIRWTRGDPHQDNLIKMLKFEYKKEL